ncbi:MAG TPA: TetR family transcriptional regulator C-terminal domain-containing protein [Rhodocyclaceae bacterium]|nr:TetR family transcriptional regulator C-terminal domain-containing protein [Rhodocyclaceae bacterium]
MSRDGEKRFEEAHLKRWWDVTCNYLFADLQDASGMAVSAGRAAVSFTASGHAPNSGGASEHALVVQSSWPATRTAGRGGQVRYLSRVRGSLLRLLKQVRQRDEDPLSELERLFQLQVWFIVHHPDVPKHLLGWLLEDGDARIRRRIRGVIDQFASRFSRIIGQAQDQGLIRADVEPHAAANLLVGVIQGLVLRTHAAPQRPESFAREAAEAFAICRAGLAQRSD